MRKLFQTITFLPILSIVFSSPSFAHPHRDLELGHTHIFGIEMNTQLFYGICLLMAIGIGYAIAKYGKLLLNKITNN